MEPEIRPEPSDDERRAILTALAADDPPEPEMYRSEWRRAALEESVAEEGFGEAEGSALQG